MSTIQVKYNELLSVAVTQFFYENNVCSRYTLNPVLDFDFIPTAETILLTKRMGLVVRSSGRTGGFIILAPTKGKIGADDLLSFPPVKGDKLSFFMLLKNPAFINFNDLPLAADSEKTWYFSNEVTGAVPARNDLHLTVATEVNSSNDYIKRSGGIYRFHYSLGTIAPGNAKVKHVFTNVEILPVSIVNESGQSDLIFDLSSIPNGKCELWIAGNLIASDVFYYMGQTNNQQIFGVIELSLSSSLSLNCSIVNANKTITTVRPFYTIKFRNRKTTWRYTINLQATSPLYQEIAALIIPADKTAFLSNLKITSNDPTVTFTQSLPPVSNDNNIVFESDTMLASKEKYIATPGVKPLSLILKKNTGLPNEAVVKSDLAYPSTGLVDALNLPSIYSDIFLTL